MLAKAVGLGKAGRELANCILILIKKNNDKETLKFLLRHSDRSVNKEAFQSLLKNKDSLKDKENYGIFKR